MATAPPAPSGSSAYGDPRLPASFWSKVDVQPDGCWTWTGRTHYRGGYGLVGRSSRAHRESYKALVEDPGDNDIDHLCRTRSCVNPAHLQAVSPAQNRLRQTAAKSGKVVGDHGPSKGRGGDKHQHTDLYRKLQLRRKLLPLAPAGAAYVPFIGEGDIAAELYPERTIYGVDLDADRVRVARGRLQGEIVVADADSWPFPELAEPIALADFDAYANPYRSLAAFWAAAPLAEQVVIFGTDGTGMVMMRPNRYMLGELPDAPDIDAPSLAAKREQYNFWWPRTALPWLTALVAPAVITQSTFYRRSQMLYWGILVDRSATPGALVDPTAGDDKRAAVVDALYEAATAGNVPAILAYLQRSEGAEPTPDEPGTYDALGYEV